MGEERANAHAFRVARCCPGERRVLQQNEGVPTRRCNTLAAFFDDHAYVGTTTFELFLEGLDILYIEWGVWLAQWKTFIALRINKLWGFSIDATEVLCSAIGICALSAR